MAAERGTYRGIYSSLPDDPDFQLLSPAARHLLLTIRIMREIGPGCIWRWYPEPIAHRTGYSMRRIEMCLRELETAPGVNGRPARWIVREGPIVWIRNGLRWDPLMKLTNKKHRDGVLSAISSLPRLQIVLDFCNYYKLAKPFDSLSDGLPGPSDRDSSSFAKRGTTPTPTPTPTPKSSSNSSSSSVNAWPSVEAFIALYNELAPDECPAAKTTAGGRRITIQGYLQKFPDRTWWEETFRQIRRSRLLRGLVPPKEPRNGRAPWVCDLDWLLTQKKGEASENCVKVHDGRYRDMEENHGEGPDRGRDRGNPW